MPSYLDRILDMNRHDLTGFRPFRIGGKALGWVRPALAEKLAAMPHLFTVDETGVALTEAHNDFASRSAALDEAARKLAGTPWLPKLRREMFPVLECWGAPLLAQIDRGAVITFGLPFFGINVNGYVRRADGLYLWLGRRADNKLVEPGKWDGMVGGGQPAGLSVEENLLKESFEEAGLPETLVRRAVPHGTISYCREQARGLERETLFVFDLEMPEDAIPVNHDGEVSEFKLVPLSEAAAICRQPEMFKSECSLVVIDFLIRQGFIAQDEADYAALVKGLQEKI